MKLITRRLSWQFARFTWRTESENDSSFSYSQHNRLKREKMNLIIYCSSLHRPFLWSWFCLSGETTTHCSQTSICIQYNAHIFYRAHQRLRKCEFASLRQWELLNIQVLVVCNDFGSFMVYLFAARYAWYFLCVCACECVNVLLFSWTKVFLFFHIYQ